MKWLGKPGSVRWSPAHAVAGAHLEPEARTLGAGRAPRSARRIRSGAGGLGLGCRAAAGGSALVAERARGPFGWDRALPAGADLTQRLACAAPSDRGALAGVDQVRWGRRERDPRA